MLSEISHTEKDKYCIYHLYVEVKIYNKLVNITKKKQAHRHKEQISGYQGKRTGRRGNTGVGEWRVQSIG